MNHGLDVYPTPSPLFVLPITPREPSKVMNMKKILPSIYYACNGYITFVEKFVTIIITVAFFDYFNHIANCMVNHVAACQESV